MKTIIFGAGANAISFLKRNLVNENLDVVKIVDNDKNKWGKKLGVFDYNIESPENIKGVDFDFVVVTPNDGDSIKAQLIENFGISRDKVCGCSDLLIPIESNLGTVELNCDSEEVYVINALIPDKIVPSNRLEEFYFKRQHNIMNKWWHYFEVYQDYFGKYVGTEVKILEIGVFKGGSMQMWKNYFGDKAQIVGIDIDEKCKAFEAENVHICIGSQADKDFLRTVSEKWGPFDIILDDGSHVMEHQIITFETLFPLLKNGGVFICEDCHTSYLQEYGGGYLNRKSFIEYSKGFVDLVNGHHFERKQKKSEIDDYIKACHFYDSMVVIEKKKRGYPIVTEFAQ